MSATATEFTLAAPPDGKKDECFLAAWKRAVKLTGVPIFFGAHTAEEVDCARTKNELKPHMETIIKRISNHPQSTGAMVAVMVSFYNPTAAEALAKKVGCIGLGALIAPLNDECRAQIIRLIAYHESW